MKCFSYYRKPNGALQAGKSRDGSDRKDRKGWNNVADFGGEGLLKPQPEQRHQDERFFAAWGYHFYCIVQRCVQ